MGGIFKGVKDSAMMALWELAGAFGVNIVANNINSAASITDATTKDIVKGVVAVVPQFFKKQLGAKADLMTAGALLVLGYNVISNSLASLGLPANVVSMLQGDPSNVIYIPPPQGNLNRLIEPPMSVSRVFPTGAAVDFKPSTH